MLHRCFGSFEDIVRTILPNFGYQLYLANGEVEKRIQSKEEIKQFLNALYGGHGPNGEVGLSVKTGPIYENLAKLQQSPLISAKVCHDALQAVPWC